MLLHQNGGASFSMNYSSSCSKLFIRFLNLENVVLIFFASLLVALVERQSSGVRYSAIFRGIGPLTYISEYPLAAAPRAACEGDEARALQ